MQLQIPRADSKFMPRQWEMALLCNNVSHWLGASLESALNSSVSGGKLSALCLPRPCHLTWWFLSWRCLLMYHLHGWAGGECAVSCTGQLCWEWQHAIDESSAASTVWRQRGRGWWGWGGGCWGCGGWQVRYAREVWALINIKTSSFLYRKSHCGDKTVVRSSYLHNGIFYIGKMSSLYWIGALGLFSVSFLA